MKLTKAIKDAYEFIGFAVLDVKHLEGTQFHEIEFIGAEGVMKKKVVTIFAMVHEPDQRQQEASHGGVE